LGWKNGNMSLLLFYLCWSLGRFSFSDAISSRPNRFMFGLRLNILCIHSQPYLLIMLGSPAPDLSRAETALLQALLNDTTGICLAYLDRNFHFALVNSAYAQTCHCTPQELIGKNLFTLPSNKEIHALFRQVRDNGVSVHFYDEALIFPNQPKTAVTYWDGVLEPTKTSTGQVTGLVFLFVETTERKKTQENLLRIKTELTAILENVDNGFISLDRRWRFIYLNSRAAENVGFTPQDLVGKNIWKTFPQLVGTEVEKTYRHVMVDQVPVVFQTHGVLTDCWYEEKVYPTAEGIAIYWTDISQRKAAEAALEEVNKNLETTIKERTEKLAMAAMYARNLIEASLDPLVTISAEGKITDVNKATEQVTGYNRAELIGSDFSDYFTEPEKAQAVYKQVFTVGFVKDYPLIIRHRLGGITEVLYNATVFKNEAGDVQGVFASARDVTERKKMEKHLQETERLAAIGATAGMVGHDLRNPLQTIIGQVFLAKNEILTLPEGEQKSLLEEAVQVIAEQIGYMDKIVSDLQTFVRPVIVHKKTLALKQLVSAVMSQVTMPKKVQVLMNVPENLDIDADPELMRRVLINLVTNAEQAMPTGGKLTITAERSQNRHVLLTVEDTGVGISDQIKDRVFQPLFTTKSKGQGFGLAVCRRVIEAQGGTITFESQESQGTKFIISLATPQDAIQNPP
jgi:PAS domain S-box-containing protein